MHDRGIVITTSLHTLKWLPASLEALKGSKYPILVVLNGASVGDVVHVDVNGFEPNVKLIANNWNGFELGGILQGAKHFKEFVHLMDTCVVHDHNLIESMFESPGSVHLSRGFYSYLGKYRSIVLSACGIPIVNTKEEAIKHENDWHIHYLKYDPLAEQFTPELPVISEIFEDKHDRKNMVLKNGFITKYKATWA